MSENGISNEAFRVGIYTLGCKVNQYESEALAELFAAEGFFVTSASDVCDVYVINTCTVTAESDRKARQIIRRMLSMNKDARVIVTGCYAQVAPEAILRINGVSAVVGNRKKTVIPALAKKLLSSHPESSVPTVSVPSEIICLWNVSASIWLRRSGGM